MPPGDRGLADGSKVGDSPAVWSGGPLVSAVSRWGRDVRRRRSGTARCVCVSSSGRPAGSVMSDAAVRGGAGNGSHVAAPGRRPPLAPHPRPFFFAVSPVGPPSPCGFRFPLLGKRPLAVLAPAISTPSGDLIRAPRRTRNGPRSPPVRSWRPSRRRAKIRPRFRAVRGARRWRAGAGAAPSRLHRPRRSSFKGLPRGSRPSCGYGRTRRRLSSVGRAVAL